MSVILRQTNGCKVLLQRASQCLYSTGKDGGKKTTPTPKAAPAKKPKAALAPAAPKAPATAPPPFDNTKYSCGEYFTYDKWSFYNEESLMTSHRCGQPSKYQ